MFPALLLQVLLVLLIAGVLLWGLTQFPLDPTIARLIKVVIVVFVCVWLIYVLFGLAGGASAGPVFPLRR